MAAATPAPSFWSSNATATWEYPLANGSTQRCVTTPRNLLRAIKRAISSPTSGARDDGRWTGPDSDKLRTRARALGLPATSIPVSAGQTNWTQEMMQLAIWVTYRQTGTPLAIAVPLTATLPRSNTTPPDDNNTTWPPPAPSCSVVEAPPSTPPTPAPVMPTRDQLIASLQARLPTLDWQASDFSSGQPLSARWGVRMADGRLVLCATQARSIFLIAKEQFGVPGYGAREGDEGGRWTTEWMDILHRRATQEWGLLPDEIPFALGVETWTRESLAFLLWGLFHRTQVPHYTWLLLAAATVLPPYFGQATPDDGFGTNPLAPLSISVNLAVPAPPPPQTVLPGEPIPIVPPPQPTVPALPAVPTQAIGQTPTSTTKGGITATHVVLGAAAAGVLWWLFG